MSGFLGLALKILGGVAALGLAAVAISGLVAAAGAVRSPYCTFLSLRYLRARKTNWIGVAGIFVAVAALILILSIMSGFLAESRKHLRGNLSDFIIAPKQDLLPLPPSDARPFLESLLEDPRVEAACVQLNWVGLLVPERRGGNLSNPVYNDLSLVNLVGIDLEDENRTTGFKESLTSTGRYTRAEAQVHDPDSPFELGPDLERDGRPLPGVVIGEQLANSFWLKVGDEAELVTATLNPGTGRLNDEPTNRKVVITGTFRTGENEMDLERVYFDRRTLGEDILARGIPWTHVLVKLFDYERDKVSFAEDVRAMGVDLGYLHKARNSFEENSLRYEVQTWEDYRGSLLGAIENEKSLMGVMLSLVVLVAGFTVFALLSMMVSEKRRDIGILASLGATPWRVMGLFVLIGCWEVLLGASLGAAAGIWSALHIDRIERWLSDAIGVQIFDRNVYLFDHIPSVVTASGVGAIVMFAIICVLVFSAFPAWRAARLDPVDALRFE